MHEQSSHADKRENRESLQKHTITAVIIGIIIFCAGLFVGAILMEQTTRDTFSFTQVPHNPANPFLQYEIQTRYHATYVAYVHTQQT